MAGGLKRGKFIKKNVIEIWDIFGDVPVHILTGLSNAGAGSTIFRHMSLPDTMELHSCSM